MLPDIGTRERERLEEEALNVGLNYLVETDGRIPDALYKVYQHFRARFIEERELMDRAPGGEIWNDALTDARRLEAHVSQVWASSIMNAETLRRSVSKRFPI